MHNCKTFSHSTLQITHKVELTMAALCNRWAIIFLSCGFYLSSIFFPRLISTVADWMSTILRHMVWPCEFRMQVWNVLHAACCKCRTQKIAIWAPSCNFVGPYLRNYGTYWQSERNLLNSNTSTCPHNMENFGPLLAEICLRVWGTPANFSGFRVLAALRHGTLLVCVSQTLRRWTEGATYIRQDGHRVGHWPTLLVVSCYCYAF